MIEAFSGYCPIQNKEVTIDLRVNEVRLRPKNGVKATVENCEYHETNDCPKINRCPIAEQRMPLG